MVAVDKMMVVFAMLGSKALVETIVVADNWLAAGTDAGGVVVTTTPILGKLPAMLPTAKAGEG